MPTLTGPEARDRLDALRHALNYAIFSRTNFLSARVRDDDAYRAAQDLVAALERLVNETEVME